MGMQHRPEWDGSNPWEDPVPVESLGKIPMPTLDDTLRKVEAACSGSKSNRPDYVFTLSTADGTNFLREFKRLRAEAERLEKELAGSTQTKVKCDSCGALTAPDSMVPVSISGNWESVCPKCAPFYAV